MAIITIIKSDIRTGDLTLDDGKHTYAKKKETIIWQLGKGCGVGSIVEIAMSPSPPYPASTNIFSTAPHRLGASTNWGAIVSDSAPDYSQYNYYIKWITTVGSEPYTYDPKILIMPETFVSIQKVVLFILAIFTACAAAILFTNKRKKKK